MKHEHTFRRVTGITGVGCTRCDAKVREDRSLSRLDRKLAYRAIRDAMADQPIEACACGMFQQTCPVCGHVQQWLY